jgi:uncharacterized protein
MSPDTAPPALADLARLALFPLPDTVLFPGTALPLHVFEPRYRRMLTDVLAQNRILGVVRLKPGFENDYYGRPALFDVCGVGRVIKEVALPDGRMNIVVLGLARARLLEELPFEPYRVVRAELLPDAEVRAPLQWAAWYPKLQELGRQLSPHVSQSNAPDLERLIREAPNAGACADRLAAALIADADERQHLLGEVDPTERLARVLERLHEVAASLGASPTPAASELN